MSPFTLARHVSKTHALPVDRLRRRLAGMGLRHLRRAALQLRRAERPPDVVRAAYRRRGGQSGAAILERHPELAAAARLGRRWRAVRADLRPLRPQARAADD